MNKKDITRKAHEAMYLFQHGDWYLDEPWQEPVGWSEDQLEVGIDAATPHIKAQTLREFKLRILAGLEQDGEEMEIIMPGITDAFMGIVDLAELCAQDEESKGE